MALDEIEALADGSEHAERQHVDLEHAERVDVVLVPLQEGAVRPGTLLGAVVDRHGLVEALAGENEAADVLGEMAREAHQLAGEPHRPADRRVGGVEARLAHALLGEVVVAAAPHQAGQRRRHVLLEAQRLAHLADRHARAVVDDGGADGGAVAAVTPIEILDHLLAPLVLEVHVDVGRLAAVGGYEALEQQIDAGGIDRGDAEAVAHHAVGGRTAALAQNRGLRLLAGEAHDVVDGEEVAGVVEPGDQRQLLGEQGAHVVGDAAGEAPRGMLPCQVIQVRLGGFAGRHRLLGVLVAQLVEREADAVGDLQRARHGLRVVGEQARHFGAGLQVPLGVGLEAIAGVGNGALLADADEHVGERPAIGAVVERVGSGNERCARMRGQLGELGQAPAFVAAVGESRQRDRRSRARRH